MKNNFNTEIKIEINSQITIGDINGNIGLTSLLFILISFLIVIILLIKSVKNNKI